MPTDTQQTPQQALVFTRRPAQITDEIHASGLRVNLTMPEVPDDISSSLSARAEVRRRIRAHSGPIFTDDESLGVSRLFLVACID